MVEVLAAVPVALEPEDKVLTEVIVSVPPGAEEAEKVVLVGLRPPPVKEEMVVLVKPPQSAEAR